MKKNYALLKAFIVLLTVFTIKLNAQISGTVTVNSGLATGGTNYQTFTALANDLNTNGVNGPLVVNVVAASGYTEQPSFSNIAGVSATNTITVNGNGALLTFNSTNSSQPWVLALDGADYMFFNNLNVWGTGTYAYACAVANGATYNTFTNCTFSVNATGTSANQIAVVLSGNISSYSNQSNSGNYNTWSGCTMSGGYYGISMRGSNSTPYNIGNRVLNCTLTNWYAMGIYHYWYSKNYVLKGNTIQRPNRTNSTTLYGIYSYYAEGTIIDGNRIQNLFDSHLGSTNSCTGIYQYWNGAGGGKANANHCRNNIISDIKHNGTIYGIRAYYTDGYVYHNTISLDNAASTSGTTYGLYCIGTNGYAVDVMNNIVSVTRGGSGTKYCMYSGSTSNISWDKNNYYLNAAAGTNYLGSYTSPVNNLAALQLQGIEANGFTVNPAFTNPAGQNYIPTATALNNVGTPVGVYSDVNNNPRSGTQPDIGAHEFLSVNCVGTPSVNTISPATYTLCPGENVTLGLTNYYSDLGITYQWQYSFTSAVGPFTNVIGATSNVFTTPNLTNSTYYGIVMTCANGNGSVNAVGYVTVAGTTTMNVPYHEDFEGINGPNKMPNCSWTSNSLGANCLTYTTTLNQNRNAHSGTKFASFYGYYVNGANYFYTNGLLLNAGVTYSASLWYQTEYYGYANFTDLSILYGTAQNTTGLVTIASTGGSAASPIYKSLSNTFTVPTTGIYYVAVRATSNGNYGAYYLSWDDLDISIPCSLNSPSVTASASSNTICSGQQVVLNATGADTYLWSTGATGSSITETPLLSTMYSVIGTSTLSGCAVTVQTQMVTVNQSPNVVVYTNKPQICAGQQVNLVANGADTYMWNTSATSAIITVTPNSTTIYTVIGTNNLNCSTPATIQVVVAPNPTVTIVSSAINPNEICKGESLTLTGGGAVSYSWSSSSLFIQSPVAIINPMSSTVYTLSGSNASGCVGMSTYVLNVSECTGINEITTTNGVKVYPNPTTGYFVVELASGTVKSIEVIDLAGRVVLSNAVAAGKVNVNISDLSHGIYYLKVQSDSSVEVIKIVKH